MKTKKILLCAALVLCAAILAGIIFVRVSEPESIAVPPEETVRPTPESTPEPTPEPTQELVPEATPEPVPEDTPEPTPEHNWPNIDITGWEYILANPTHDIGEYVPELTELEYGQYFDSRAVDALKEFIAAARSEGLSVCLSSSYRSYADQQYLFNRKVSQYGGDVATASTIVAPPGTSEHQTGLCCDITDKYYESKDRSLENTELFKWMYAHCAEYGFILRYPDGKQDITGIIYEPWHFRYVGMEAAGYIMENGLCLEEFLELYE